MTALAQKARLSVAWTTGINAFRDVMQFGLMLVMVRLIPAEAYGQFGLVNTILGFVMVFSSREFIAHTLLVRDDSEVNYQEQFVAGCVIQASLCVVVNLIAVAARFFPAYAPVAPLLHLMSLSVLLDLPSELRNRMLERNLNWPRLRTVEAIGILGAAVLTLTLGLAGAGVYALLIPSFAIPTAFLVDLFVIAGWRPTFAWNAERYRASRSFGVNRVFGMSFVSAAGLLESGVLARSVGYGMLGVFGRATSMATLFCHRVSWLLMTALYPVLARVPPRSDAYQRVSALVLRTVAWLVVPVAVVVSLNGGRIVTTLYGSKWLSVIPLVPSAMLVGASLAVVQASYSLLLAHGEPRRCRHADLWRLVGISLALVIALPFGLAPYLLAVAGVHALALALLLTSLIRSGGILPRGIASAILPAAGAAVVAALVAEASRALFMDDLPAIPTLVLHGLIFGTVYLVALRVLFARLLRELVGYLPEAGRMHRLLGFAEAA